jgi:hypothetical protein
VVNGRTRVTLLSSQARITRAGALPCSLLFLVLTQLPSYPATQPRSHREGTHHSPRPSMINVPISFSATPYRGGSARSSVRAANESFPVIASQGYNVNCCLRLLVVMVCVPGFMSGCRPYAPPTREQVDTGDRRESVKAIDPKTLPEIRPSRFLNTSLQVAYVKNASCLACHEKQFQSYLETNHSRALQVVDRKDEPQPGEFTVPESGRTYRVEWVGDQLWHHEFMKLASGEEMPLDSHPIQYAIGSGHHSRSYLAEIDGFLIESPATWYRDTQAWGLSPGFLHAHHASFERMADSGCLVCHAGQVAETDGNRFRPRVLEPVIGCESCHGPGELHLQHHGAGRLADDEDAEDLTIVNPRRLPRAESEAICAQCHLRGDATVAVRGRKISDFRPGQQLADFRVDFFVEQPGGEMTVVGHVEQMWSSRCYQQSTELTCTTCHNPHIPVRDQERLTWHRARCLSCHNEEACGLDMDRRLEQQPNDDCLSCHMPKGRTDIPHFAFTHHRIGIHPPSLQEPTSPARNPIPRGKLVPRADLTHFSAGDQQRLWGLAELEWAEKQTQPEARRRIQQQAETHLQAAVAAGLADTAVHVALARLAWERQDLGRAREFSERALNGVPRPQRHVDALFILGDCYLQHGRPDLALPFFEQLVTLRRASLDWSLLGYCQQQQGNPQAAWDAFRRAASIAPAESDLLETLIGLSRERQDAAAEATYTQRLRMLPSSTLPGSSARKSK